jgi:pimeloyl-ACP methyl ester carboxylesterase
MPEVQVSDVRLYYEEYGAGEPLVLIPGFGSGLWIWYRQIPAFAEHFGTIAFDPRGVSRSRHRDEPFNMGLLADDVAALLSSLDIERAHILGASFGGFVAQEFALRYPARTRSLVLCCTSYGGPRHCPPAPETLAAIASTKGLNTDERVRQNLLLAFSPAFVEREREEVERVIRLRAENPLPESAYMRQLQAALDFNAEPRVSEIQAPTLVITGDEDVIVPHENSLNLAARIPCAELRIVHGGSHTFFIERPGEFNRAVIDFIETQAGEGKRIKVVKG